MKDISALYLDDPTHFRERLQTALNAATPWADVEADGRMARLAELRTQAAAILAAPDPLVLIEAELRRLGYGGDVRPAQTLYVSGTTRLLHYHPGAMASHTNVIGPPGLGKSWAVKIALGTYPASAYDVIDASSPRVFIYDHRDDPECYRHRIVIFGEADSLPSGEDNPAASAMRNLLQDGHVHYKVVVKNPLTGKFDVDTIVKPGPTLLITTSVKHLPAQMDSRVFTLEVPDTPEQLRAALQAQARLELHGQPAADPGLVAFQEYLQLQTPWNVIVPFADRLSRAVGEKHIAPRVVRDFIRLLSLVKAVTVLRHAHRQRDAAGRLVASVEDYRTVYHLVGPMYEAAASEASPKTRETVAAVKALIDGGRAPVTKAKLATALGISNAAAGGRANTAIRKGFLVNAEKRDKYPAILEVGEDLPDRCGLPRPEDLTTEGLATSTETTREEPAAEEPPAQDDIIAWPEEMEVAESTAATASEADASGPDTHPAGGDRAGARPAGGNGTDRADRDDIPDEELSDAEFCRRHGCSLEDLRP